MRMSSSPGSVKFWHLDILTYIRIALRAFSSGGNVLLSLWLLICKKRAHQITDSMSCPPDFILWCEMVGHSIVFIIGCSLFYEKINSILWFLRGTCIIFLWEGFHIYIHSLTFLNSFRFHWNLLDHSHCFVAAPSGSVLNRTEVLLKFFYCLLTSVSFFFFLSFISGWNILRTICTRHRDKYSLLFVLGSFYGPGWISAILLRSAVQFPIWVWCFERFVVFGCLGTFEGLGSNWHPGWSLLNSDEIPLFYIRAMDWAIETIVNNEWSSKKLQMKRIFSFCKDRTLTTSDCFRCMHALYQKLDECKGVIVQWSRSYWFNQWIQFFVPTPITKSLPVISNLLSNNFYFVLGNEPPFKTSAFFRGGGVKNLQNLPTDSTKKLPMVGG